MKNMGTVPILRNQPTVQHTQNESQGQKSLGTSRPACSLKLGFLSTLVLLDLVDSLAPSTSIQWTACIWTWSADQVLPARGESCRLSWQERRQLSQGVVCEGRQRNTWVHKEQPPPCRIFQNTFRAPSGHSVTICPILELWSPDFRINSITSKSWIWW